ncbi:MAG: hypothetical protein PWP16_1068 [Eubacteriaceae bacterium]|jgi:hypothetical protein|nr:hypothetical protein [Eubacteriaceae bacterium]MDN5307705.1 hypothetical protein [Eubacteriaceae bacterium]
MQEKKYSAGMVKFSFWFSEFRQVLGYLAGGKTMKEIKEMIQRENLFMASSKARSTMIFSTVSRRIKSLPKDFYPVFELSDISNQKIIVLIAIMLSDALFFDFMHEVYREKLIIGVEELKDSDITIFFKNKQIQDEKVAGWKDETLKRLGASYKNVLMEAGLIGQSKGSRKILKPILDKRLEDCLKDNDLLVVLNALTGVR